MVLHESAAEAAMQKHLEQSWIKLVQNAEKIKEQDLGSQFLNPRSGQGSPRSKGQSFQKRGANNKCHKNYVS